VTDLAALVDEARVRNFVGRQAELADFTETLHGGAHRVLFVHGPGGIGKTTLLHQFRSIAARAGHDTVVLDGRDLDASPEQFSAAVSRTGDGADTALSDVVLLVDGYEQLDVIDDWIREQILVRAGDNTTVVFFGRNPPRPPWRTDPGWRAVVGVYALKSFDSAESSDLLTRAGVPPDAQEHLVELGRGHPLTLALLADAALSGVVPEHLADAPDLVATLAEQIVDVAPDDAHALGLALCTHAFVMTGDLLEDAVDDRAGEVWQWLEERPFVSRGVNGLYPHDLVRDVLDADLRRRAPELYRQVHRFVHERALRELRGGGPDRQLWAHQKLFLHRHSPLASAFWAMRHRGAGSVVPALPQDHRAALDMIERFEGRGSADLAERWFAAQPENLVVSRSGGETAGFAFQAVYPDEASLCDTDPVMRTVVETVERVCPPRPGEQVSVGRFFSGTIEHQRDAHAVIAGAVGSTLLWATRPLAWSFIATTDPEFWRPIFDYLALTTRFPAEFEGRAYTVFGIDWRRLPFELWFEVMAERELTGESGPAPANRLRPAPLSRDQFAAALRGALRDLPRLDRLSANELIGSRLALEPDGASADRLRASICEGVERLREEARARDLYAVLHRTYVQAAPTQEAAAEVLGLPFSTYRRHHAAALERLTDLLWAVEIGEIRLGTK
jgi:AAA ATPase domain